MKLIYLDKISHNTIGLVSSTMLYKEVLVENWEKFDDFHFAFPNYS